VPLNDKIDGAKYLFFEKQGASAEEQKLYKKYPHHLPRFEDGKVSLIIGPQLSIGGMNWLGYSDCGNPYCPLDQSIFMAYDLSRGLNYGRQPYSLGVGGGNIQPYKSRAGDGRIREGTTVQNGTPVGRPIIKTLSSACTWDEVELREAPFVSFAPMPASITEDYREGEEDRRHGHGVVFHNTVVAVGSAVDFPMQILAQRRRWPASVPIGQYWIFRNVWDEVVKAKALGFAYDYPSFYTWDQLLQEWNGVTWYYCGPAEYLRSYAPLAFWLGFTAYPVDAMAFPVIWFINTISSMWGHVYTMKKVGNHQLESLFFGQAAHKAIIPNYLEMLLPQPDLSSKGRRIIEEAFTARLNEEFLGQFGVTALAGAAKMPPRYRNLINLDIALKAATFARGVLTLGDAAHLNALEGDVSPDWFAQASDYFAIVMNTFWPYYDMTLNRGSRALAENDRDKETNMNLPQLHHLRARMLLGKLPTGKLQRQLGMTDPPKTDVAKAKYLEDLGPQESAHLLRVIPSQGAQMLDNYLDKGYLKPQKVAAILEEMLKDNNAITARITYLIRMGMSFEQASQIAYLEAVLFAALAAYIFSRLRRDNQQAVREAMKKSKGEMFDGRAFTGRSTELPFGGVR
jgi:hypothetical protein